MSLHHVHLANCPSQPWRNGGGRTRELMVWPQAHDWALRVSVADIEHSGPFSAYPGVDRWFAVVKGAGVTLDLADGPRTLTPADQPVFFAGETAPACHLLHEPTRDLNLMVQRDGRVSQMRRAAAGAAIEGSTQWRGLYTAGPAVLECDGVAQPVHAGTLVWSDDRDDSTWTLRQATQAWFLLLED